MDWGVILDDAATAAGKEAAKAGLAGFWRLIKSFSRSKEKLPKKLNSNEEFIELLIHRAEIATPKIKKIDHKLALQFSRLHKKHIDAIKNEKYLLAHELRGQISTVLSKAQGLVKRDNGYGSGDDTFILYSEH